MPDPKDHAALSLALLANLRRGPASGRALREALGISQSTLSRLVAENRADLVVLGRARSTRYAARRVIDGVPPGPLPIYEVASPQRPTRHLLDLHPVWPDGFAVTGRIPGVADAHFLDLPWFLFDQRPSGFLGRLLPRRHPELGNPSDIRLWSSDHVLRYLVRYGSDAPGALVVGQAAMEAVLSGAGAPSVPAAMGERARAYAHMADDVLRHGAAGSSAAGEQPKLLATRDDGAPVLVKFSPVADTPVARRTADLLIAEHLALETLREHGHDAALSVLLHFGGRTFLEVERFDREGRRHRRGVVSLMALDAEHVGSLISWSVSATALCALGLVRPRDEREVHWLQAFGTLIGNTDMHSGNLSFFLDGTTPGPLAPVYDMVPMHFGPRSGALVDAVLEPRLDPALAPVWPTAREAALSFWSEVLHDARVSEDFRHIARRSWAVVDSLEEALAMLPR